MSPRLLLPMLGLVFVAMLGYSWVGQTSKRDVMPATGPAQETVRAASATPTRGTSMVRFVNAMPGSPALDIMRDSTMLFGNVKFGAVSPYKEIRDSLARFALRTPGAAIDVAVNSETMRRGAAYTVVAMSDREGGMRLHVVRDSLLPESGKARVRVIHAAPGLEDIDVAIAGATKPLFADINYGEVASVADVRPMTAGFIVHQAGARQPLLSMKSQVLTAGVSYTFILTARPTKALALISFFDKGADLPVPVASAR